MRSSRLYDEVTTAFDIITAYLAFYGAYLLYFGLISPEAPPAAPYFAISLMVLPIWGITILALKPARRSRPPLVDEIWPLARINLVAGLVFGAVFFGFKAEGVSRAVAGLFPMVAFLAMLAYRLVLRGIWRFASRDDRTHLLIVTQSGRAQAIQEQLASGAAADLRVAAVLEIPERPRPGHQELGLPELASSLERCLHSKVIDLVFLDLPITNPFIEPAIQICEAEGKEVRMVLDGLAATMARLTVTDFYGVPALSLRYTSDNYRQLIFKRIIDILVSFLGLLLLAPLLAAISLAIKLTSEGPVFFKQERVGLHGRTFWLYKFRTMVDKAEQLKESLQHLNEMSGPVFKVKNDPRVTAAGRFLRKTSLDELPQMINVLKGEMSLVGPRPPLPAEVRQYQNQFRRRLSVRPGITCLWQISGRNTVDFDQWMALDMRYIDNWSLELDLKILLKTIPAVLFGRGAS